MPSWRLPAVAIETWLEHERDQIGLWLPIALGAGIGLWFLLPAAHLWLAAGLLLAGLGTACLAVGRGGRAMRMAGVGALVAAVGLALAWGRSADVASPVLGRPQVTTFQAEVVAVDALPARDSIRLLLAPRSLPTLPARVRVTIDAATAPSGLEPGAVVSLRARLVPPPFAAVPGAYDFARVAWFKRIGATGKALGAIAILSPAHEGGAARWLATHRTALTHHIQAQLPGSTGGVAAAFVTGDVGAISDEDSDAMRRSGLAHLLSISGLHVAAAIGAAMLLTLKLLALSPRLALRWPLHLIAAAAGALAGIGYTLLSGAEIPTIRSCVAAVLVLAGLALGREAMTLRLVATGAIVVLLLWPEALVGPSFQLSFAAVTAIVAVHDHPRVRAFTLKRDEALGWRALRELGSLLLTGVAVEAALAPIGLYHFHKSGLYGALANIVAIPLSTFAVMPAEALALLFDLVGLGQPFWWVAGMALHMLLWIARTVSALPGAVQALPSMPLGAYLIMVAGGLWIALWRARARWWGIVPLVLGGAWAMATAAPDMLVTDDGRHLAIRTQDGHLHLLRARAGDYVRDLLGTGVGITDEALELEGMPGTRCSDDACMATIVRDGGAWRLLALRSRNRIDWADLTRACAWADVVVADRRLPRGCMPRWLKLDAAALRQTGGVAIGLSAGRVVAVRAGDRHPWIVAQSKGRSIEGGGVENQRGPVSSMWKQSSSRTPKLPGR